MAADRHRRLRLPLPVDRHPGRQQGLRDPDVVRLLRGRQGRDRQLRDAEPRVDRRSRRCPRTCRTPSSRRRTGRSGPTRASTPRASCARSSTTRPSDTTQGASTITQQYVKILYLTQERSYERKVKEAVLSLKIQRTMSEDRDPRGLPQHHLLRPRRVRRPGRLRGVLRQGRQGPHRCASPPSWRACSTTRRASTRPTARTPSRPSRSATTTCSTAWPRPTTSPPRRPRRPRAGCRSSRRSEAESRYGGQKGHMLTMVRKELLRLGFERRARSTAAACGSPPPSPRRRWPPPSRASPRQRPEGLEDKELHVARRERRARHRCGARLLRRPGLPRVPDQLGRHRRPGRLDVQAVRGGRRAQDGFSLKDTFDGQLAVSTTRDGTGRRRERGQTMARLRLRGQPAQGDRGLHQHRVRRPDARMDDGPDKILKTAEDLGLPQLETRTRAATTTSTTAPASSRSPASRSARRRSSPINMANAYATIANGGRAPSPTSSRRSSSADGEVLYTHKVRHTERRRRRGHRGRHVVRHAAGRADRHRARRRWGSAARPPARPVPRPTSDGDVVSSAWFVGYTPQLATAVMYVRGKGQGQLDGWLPSRTSAAPTRRAPGPT